MSFVSQKDLLKEAAELKNRIKLKEGLPHLFAYNLYRFQHEFLNSKARDILTCCANQIGKSTIGAIKAITWATDPIIWPSLWQSKPRMFAYFYPSLKLADMEYREKWVKDLLPRNEFKDHPQYGWKEFKKGGLIHYIEFNSGVSIYFMSYSQDEMDIQAFTAWAIFLDEEAPESVYYEIISRLRATRGYFHMVFTPTRGELLWQRCFANDKADDPLPNALKQQVSLWDCQKYVDGSQSQWTKERITEEINRCGSQQEIDRRIYGRFVVSEGLMYPSFDRIKNVKKGHPTPKDWHIYAGVDIGSGGKHGHPASICFVAVSPDFTQGRMIKCWRGDGIQTTSTDILAKFRELKGDMRPVMQVYDFAAKDFHLVAQRAGEPFIQADKSQEIGQSLINTLFRNEMLVIYNDDAESEKMIRELCSLLVDTPKRKAKDDLVDCLRYATMSVPWNYIGIGNTEEKQILDKRDTYLTRDEYIAMRKKMTDEEIEKNMQSFSNKDIEQEFEEFYNI